MSDVRSADGSADGRSRRVRGSSMIPAVQVDEFRLSDGSGRMGRQLRRFLDGAFEGDFGDDDWEHSLGGVHFVAVENHRIVGHAAVVDRSFEIDDARVPVGYVEAVAVDPTRRGTGVASALMARVESLLVTTRRMGALSPTDAGRRLYLRRGWCRWDGELYVRHPDGRLVTSPDAEVLVWSSEPKPTARDGVLVADWRDGGAW